MSIKTVNILGSGPLVIEVQNTVKPEREWRENVLTHVLSKHHTEIMINNNESTLKICLKMLTSVANTHCSMCSGMMYTG